MQLWNYKGEILSKSSSAYSLTPLESMQIMTESIDQYCTSRSDCFFYFEATDIKNNVVSTNFMTLTSLAEVKTS
jgi:hypothetical protein